MERGDNRLADGFRDLSSGMDSGRNPSLIDVNQAAFLVNTTCRGGFLDQRPGFPKIQLTFQDADVQDWYSYHNWQGGTVYNPYITESFLVASVGGRIFKITVDGAVLEITPGVTAYASVVANYTQPAVGASVTVAISDNTQYVVDRTVWITSGGYYRVSAAPVFGTQTTAAYVQPAVAATVTISVASTTGIIIGRTIFVETGGYYTVTAVPSATTVTIQNLGYTGNAAVAANVPSGSVVHGADITIQNLGASINAAPGLPISLTSAVKLLGSQNSSVRPKAYFQQAEQFLIIQDGQGLAIIFDGAGTRRAVVDGDQKEVPTGTVMAYGNGRLWVCVNERYFVAGDIVGSTASGTAKYDFNDSLLRFTENDYLNEGGLFRVPLSTGPITAMQFIAVPDTSLGQGPLQIFTQGGVYSMDVPVDRDLWKNIVTPIQTTSQIGYGALSDRSTILVNGDIFYRAKDGIRSYAITRREIGTWGHTPLSREMDRVLNRDTERLLEFSSAVMFDNRLLMTCTPVPRPNSCYHLGLVALDFDLLSNIRGKLPPAYDGLWTGLNIVQLVKGEFMGTERCFVAAITAAGVNELWEISTDAVVDNSNTRIQSVIETRSMAFRIGETAPPSDSTQFKSLVGGELWIDRVQGEVDFTVQFRPDQFPCWFDWHNWSECQIMSACQNEEESGGCTVHHYRPGYRPKMGFPQPPDDAEEGLDKPARYGCEFQLRITWLGKARLKNLKVFATAEQEDTGGHIAT